MDYIRRGGDPVVRDALWVEREYGQEKWPVVLGRIRACIGAGERSLSRVIADVLREELGCPGLGPVTSVALGERVQLPGSLAWYGMHALIAESVISACRPNTGAIIDLGCGWGRSLFEIWLRGGPPAATYHGFEFTSTGLDCVTALAALEPSMSVRTARFDFQKPDFSSLACSLEHAVVFTVSSLHQVPFVDREAYRAILGIATTIDCLHFEQIGWQINPGEATVADHDYALGNDYNRNLWDILSGLSKSREIEFYAVHADLFGPSSRYPLSLVQWRRG